MKTQSNLEKQNLTYNSNQEKGNVLIYIADWISDKQLTFRIGSIGLAIMLIWGGLFKLTPTGAEGIIPMVSNSPLLSWHFKVFGPYIGADIIGMTEITAAILIIIGHFKPKVGIIGSLIATSMFFLTSTLFLSTPGTVGQIGKMWYMTVIGLFLFKDIIALSLALYLVTAFGARAKRI